MKLIELNNIGFKLPHMERSILKDINYTINKGDFVVLLGSNGSGKSSLLKLIDGHYQKTQGTMELFHLEPKRIFSLNQSVQDSLFFDLTVWENFCLYCRGKENKTFFQQYIKRFNPHLCDQLSTQVKFLSGGQKQSLALGLILYLKPQLLLLDEHTSALDPQTSKTIIELTYQVVREAGITCLMTTHNLDHAVRFGHRILALKEGEIYYTCDDRHSLQQDQLLATCF